MENSFRNRYRKLGMTLYEAYSAEETGPLLIEYAKEVFWGQVIKDFFLIFDNVWNRLHNDNYYKNNTFDHGDADYSVWIEEPKAKYRKVIISTCHCSCNGNDTFIFMQDKFDQDKNSDEWILFRIATAWGRQITRRKGHKFGDSRDIIRPSVRTFRDFDFSPLHGGFHDRGHVLFYDSHSIGEVEKSHITELFIPHALQTLVYTLNAFEDGD